MKETVRLNFDFPAEEYPYLKLLCAKKKTTLKKLATDLLLKAIEDYEEEMFAKRDEERSKNTEDEGESIDWEDAMKMLESKDNPNN